MISYKRYAVIYAITVFTVYMVISLLQNLAGLIIPMIGAIFAAPICASMDAGQRFYAQNNAQPTNGDAWRGAVYMSVVGAGVIVAFTIGELILNATDSAGFSVGPLVMGVVTYVFIVTVVSVPIQRFMFGFGAKNSASKK